VENQQGRSVPLSDEDRYRMEKLHEEVEALLREMSLIMGRNLGVVPSTEAVGSQEFRIAPVDAVSATGAGVEDAPVRGGWDQHCRDDVCICYDYDKGLCCEGTCPC